MIHLPGNLYNVKGEIDFWQRSGVRHVLTKLKGLSNHMERISLGHVWSFTAEILFSSR